MFNFGYKELLNLDIRDLWFWYKEAKKRTIIDQMNRLHASRSANLKDDAYKGLINSLEGELKKIDIGEDAFYRESWNDLRVKKGG